VEKKFLRIKKNTKRKAELEMHWKKFMKMRNWKTWTRRKTLFLLTSKLFTNWNKRNRGGTSRIWKRNKLYGKAIEFRI